MRIKKIYFDIILIDFYSNKISKVKKYLYNTKFTNQLKVKKIIIISVINFNIVTTI